MQLPVQIGTIIDEKYRVDAFLGSGAMSVVALAFHLELEQQVAIKFLRAQGFDPEQTAQRFKREARAGARLHSEHVVRVFDVGTLAEGGPYIVMEHLRGNDLGHELAARGRLPAGEVVGYMLEACEALAEAHAAGVVHRDLKPENLFLAERSDGARIIKLLDFGISKSMMGKSQTDLALTRTATFMGSPLYMSPEQMRSSRNVDAGSDIWSLGAIFYELLSGQLPFIAESIPELCLAVIGNEPTPLDELVPDLPQGLAAIVQRCLEKDRAKRYATVAQLALDLAPFAPLRASSPERTARILALTSPPLLGPVSSETARAPRQSSVVPPRSPPALAALSPPTRQLAEAVTMSERPPRPLYAPALLAAAVVLGAALWWLTRAPPVQPEAPIAVNAPVAPVAANTAPAQAADAPPTRADTTEARLAAAPEREDVASPPIPSSVPPAARVAPPRRPANAARSTPTSTPAAVRSGSKPSAAAPNSWDPATFGGRY